MLKVAAERVSAVEGVISAEFVVHEVRKKKHQVSAVRAVIAR